MTKRLFLTESRSSESICLFSKLHLSNADSLQGVEQLNMKLSCDQLILYFPDWLHWPVWSPYICQVWVKYSHKGTTAGSKGPWMRRPSALPHKIQCAHLQLSLISTEQFSLFCADLCAWPGQECFTACFYLQSTCYFLNCIAMNCFYQNSLQDSPLPTVQ